MPDLKRLVCSNERCRPPRHRQLPSRSFLLSTPCPAHLLAIDSAIPTMHWCMQPRCLLRPLRPRQGAVRVGRSCSREHFLLLCPLYAAPRDALLSELRKPTLPTVSVLLDNPSATKQPSITLPTRVASIHFTHPWQTSPPPPLSPCLVSHALYP